eukprot:UN06615
MNLFVHNNLKQYGLLHMEYPGPRDQEKKCRKQKKLQLMHSQEFQAKYLIFWMKLVYKYTNLFIYKHLQSELVLLRVHISVFNILVFYQDSVISCLVRLETA